MSEPVNFAREAEKLAAAIIDAIPGAIGMTPDPWPDGPHPSDGLPHKDVAGLIEAALVRLYGGIPRFRAHATGCRRALSVPVDLCDCGGRWFPAGPDDDAKAALATLRASVEAIVQEMRAKCASRKSTMKVVIVADVSKWADQLSTLIDPSR